MAITREIMEKSLKEIGLTVTTDGQTFVNSTPGRYAPAINTIITIDEDGTAATVMAALTDTTTTTPEKRAAICELLNLVHGQNLWNVRFHLDEAGRVFSIGKVQTWGRPFNQVQFGDIVFTLLVTTDRLYPCLEAVQKGNRSPEEAFELFFLGQGQASKDDEEKSQA